MKGFIYDIPASNGLVKINFTHDEEAGVWIATSAAIDGLAIEADSFEKLLERVTGAIADLLELNGPAA
jgi:hypothetical protein